MRTLELRLFHRYTTVTNFLIPRCDRIELEDLFVKDVPQLCFGHDAVLSCILGLAALDLLSTDPSNSTMKRVVQYYLAKTMNQHSQMVSNIDNNIAEPALLVSILLILQLRLRAVFINEGEPYKLPLEYFHMERGSATIFHMCLPFLQGSNLLTALCIEPAKFDGNAISEECLPSLIWQDSQAILRGKDNEETSLVSKAICKGAVSYLHVLYISLLREEDSQWTRRRHAEMLANIPRGFVDLLERQDPQAMAILARLMALMKLCDGIRYYRGTAEYEVVGIASLMPPDWQWAMEWPFRILELTKLSDCESEDIAPDLEWSVDLTGGACEFDFNETFHFSKQFDGSDPSYVGTRTSSYNSITTLNTSISDRSASIYSRPKSYIRKCLELEPIQAARVVLRMDEIIARRYIRTWLDLESL